MTAFTIEDEGETPEFSSTVEATAAGPNGTPLVYGGAWPHDPEDTRLKRRGFRACRSAEQERIEAELAKGPGLSSQPAPIYWPPAAIGPPPGRLADAPR